MVRSARLERVEERLALIRKLKKKYGGSVEEVLAHAEASRRELEGIEGSSELARQLEIEIAALEKELKTRAGEISRARRQAAAGLQVRVEEELKQLGMPKVRFQVDLQDRTNEAGKLLYTATGKDRDSISSSLGAMPAPGPIAGGEMCGRTAQKNVLANRRIGADLHEVDSGAARWPCRDQRLRAWPPRSRCWHAHLAHHRAPIIYPEDRRGAHGDACGPGFRNRPPGGNRPHAGRRPHGGHFVEARRRAAGPLRRALKRVGKHGNGEDQRRGSQALL
jgi:hypothetical protein